LVKVLAKRKWAYNPRNKRWVLIEYKPSRKPPCRIVKVAKRKPKTIQEEEEED